MSRHLLPTRLIHMGFAIAVITQLLTSLVMTAPHPRPFRAGDLFFEIHEYSGLAALALALLLSLWLPRRKSAGADRGRGRAAAARP